MDTSQLTLWKLEIFCQVIEDQSFSKAARSLGITQPTVSGHMSDLEKLFGSRLFDRSSGKITPTRAGHLLSEQGEKLQQLKAETLRRMRNHLGLVEGDVTIGGSTIPGTYILPGYLARFKRMHPELLITLRIGDSQEIVDEVLRSRLELGVVGSTVSHPSLTSRSFVEDELVVALPANHPLTKEQQITGQMLRDQPFLVRERGSGTRQLMEAALQEAHGQTLSQLQIVCELGSSAAIMEAVRQGLGISLISIHATRREQQIGSIEVRPLAGIDLNRRFQVICHRKRTLSPGARVLHDLLRDGAQKTP